MKSAEQLFCNYIIILSCKKPNKRQNNQSDLISLNKNIKMWTGARRVKEIFEYNTILKRLLRWRPSVLGKVGGDNLTRFICRP